jgi:cell division protein FtsI/penicillin-binding protein 2
MVQARHTTNRTHKPHNEAPVVFTPRLLLLLGGVTIVCLLILTRLFFIQLINGPTYRLEAERMYGGAGVRSSTSERGDIVMVNKQGVRYMLAGQKSTYYIVLDPKKIVSVNSVYSSLKSLLPSISRSEFDGYIREERKHKFQSAPLDKQYIEQILGKRESYTGVIAPGLMIVTEKVRSYPGGSLASHVLGFVGYVGDTLEGRYGLERQYDDLLRVHDTDLYSNFFVELFSTLKSLSAQPAQLAGQAVLVTTLEPEIQSRSEQMLRAIEEKYHPKEVGVVVIESSTGAVRAMARTPSFDVNDFRSETDIDVFTNSLIQKVFEVGSIMKPLVMAYAFEEGKVSAETTYTDKGSVVVNDRTIYNYDKKARGLVTMEEVLIQSLNTGMVFVMDKLDRKGVRDYLESLGLREETGIDLPYEATGLTKNIDTLRRVEYANISFGQGIAVTPIAMLRALNILANHGKLIQPYVVEKIEYPYGAGRDLGAVARAHQNQIISTKTADEVADIMVKLVDKNFKNDPHYLSRYSVAAKTGTAQIASGSAGYGEGRKLHTFFGFLPARDPQFSIFMYAVEPQGVKYSAETLSGPFLELTQFLVNYYNIPPDRGLKVQ